MKSVLFKIRVLLFISCVIFSFIWCGIAFSYETPDIIERFILKESPEFAPTYLKKREIASEYMVSSRQFIEEVIKSQKELPGPGAISEDSTYEMKLELKGPNRTPTQALAVNNSLVLDGAEDPGLSNMTQFLDEAYNEVFENFMIDSGEISYESYLINCGSSGAFTDASGNVWMKDERFEDLWRWGYASDLSNIASTEDLIEGTDLQDVYRSNRWGDVSYKIDMPDGLYNVTLMFAETYFEAANMRVFDVALEGSTLWRDVDIFSLAGGYHDKAIDLSQTIVVADNCLDITFPVVRKDNPMISGIKIEAVEVSDDAVLDFVQRKMFWFFCNETNPDNGLVKWGENNWDIGYGNVSSIASNGFALSAYTIGVERGWISEYEAYQRTIKMLDSFNTLLDNAHGFWYHLVYMRDNPAYGQYEGKRADDSEISTVDSSLFIMGALQAGEYFKDSHPDVASKAADLYERMDWTWFTGIASLDGNEYNKRFVNMGWKPGDTPMGDYKIPSLKEEGGYYCNGWWNSYSESIFVDLLAFGAPNPDHRIDYSAWRDMDRNWVNAFGYDFMQCPPLFTHQYQHIYFDLTDKHDAFADYFLNAQLATLANRQTCLEDPLSRYEEDIWGLTSCGGPDNKYHAYGGYPGGGHDGTVAPTAAAASLMFTQDESMAAIRKMYFKYKDLVWGLHGFSDSFNIGVNFRDWSANALDNGAMILGIENFRTGLIRDTFMRNEFMIDALSRAGFSHNGGVCQSSSEGAGFGGSMAFDGDISTRWSSQWSDTPQWLEYDFVDPVTFNTIRISWEDAYAKTYKIQISDNRVNWEDIYYTYEGDGGVDEIIVNETTARYVRIYGIERATEWGYSIYEAGIDNVEYFKLLLPEVGWSVPGGSYNSTGAASSQMLLNYLREGAGASLLEDQDIIYEYAKSAGILDGSELTPDEIDMVLGHFDPYDSSVTGWSDTYDSLPGGNPYQGYNYSVETFDAGEMDEYLRDICHWIAYTVTQEDRWEDTTLAARAHSPAILPLYGSYNNWVTVTGFVASANPCPDPINNPSYTPDVDIYGLWLSDPSPDGIGSNIYVSYYDLVMKYLKPLDTEDEYDGLLLQIAEPPIF